jgi:hypothetical protein
VSQSPRRWFQISLTTLFVLTFGVDMFFAGWAAAERRAQREADLARQEADAAIEAALQQAAVERDNANLQAALNYLKRVQAFAEASSAPAVTEPPGWTPGQRQ